MWMLDLGLLRFILNGVVAVTKRTSHQGTDRMLASLISFSIEPPFSISMHVYLKSRHGGHPALSYLKLYPIPPHINLVLEFLIGMPFQYLAY